jgi:hypothetical protein
VNEEWLDFAHKTKITKRRLKRFLKQTACFGFRIAD